jgi:uncharacterized protein involved in outer membrane biogenesis
MNWNRLRMGAAVLAIVVLGGALVAFEVAGRFGPEALEARLLDTASQALGMELGIGGHPVLHLFPRPQITLEDVQLRRQGVTIVSTKRVTARVVLLSLLGDEPRLRSVELTEPVLRLERGQDGRFNVVPPARAASTTSTARAWPELSLTGASIVFTDRRDGQNFEARDCSGGVHGLWGAALLRELSFTAELACGQLRRGRLTLFDLRLAVDAKDGIVDLHPLSANLFGTPGDGSIRADFSGAVPSYRIAYTLKQFPIEAFFRTMELPNLATGRMDLSATLSTRGSAPRELRQALTGQVVLRGKGLTFVGTDLDASFERVEASQSFSLVDVGAVFFAGPAGLLVTKGFDFAKIPRGAGGTSEIRTLVSEWKIEHGVAKAVDVAMATRANRVVLHGGLDLVNERFDDVSIALVDAKGCVRLKQAVRGSFQQPQVERPNPIAALAGPAVRLLQKGGELIFGERCEVFYAGAVDAPR